MSSYNVQIVKSQIWQQHNPSEHGSSSRLFIQNFCRVPSSRKRGVVGHQMTSGEEEKCSRKDEKITGWLKKFFPSAAPGKREVDQVMHSRSKLSLERYCQHHRFNRNFVLGFGSWTNNAKLLPFKLSKISSHRPIILLGWSNLIIEMIISIVTWIISIIVPSLSLSGCFLSKLENDLDHLVRRISENGRIIPPKSTSYVSPPHFQSTFQLVKILENGTTRSVINPPSRSVCVCSKA